MKPKRGDKAASRTTRRIHTVNKVWPDGSVRLRLGPAKYRNYSPEEFDRLYYVK